MGLVYLPELGMVAKATLKVDTELRRYDERLYLKKNPHTGDFCVYVRMPYWSTAEDVPVLGLGDTMPLDWRPVLEKIQKMDTQRHASNMIEDITRHNDEIRREAKQKADEATLFAAEVIEYAKRREGKSPVVKSVRPSGRRW